MTTLILALMAMTFTFHGDEVSERGLDPITCTAVMVSHNKALTAGHCVERLALIGDLSVTDHKDRSHGVKYLASDYKLDLALIQISGGPYPYPKLGAMPKRGDVVLTLNSGGGMPNTYNSGMVCNLIKDRDYRNIPMIVHNAMIMKGASGSGLFNEKGELIGINVVTYQGFSQAVDINAVRGFLKKNNVKI